jgi:cytidylate kinase
MVLSKLDGLEFEVIKMTLICSEDSFRKRVSADIVNNLREKEALDKGLERIPLYKNMDTIKIDTSDISILETANKIIEIIEKQL